MYIAVTNDDNRYYRAYSLLGSMNLKGCITLEVANDFEIPNNEFYKLIGNGKNIPYSWQLDEIAYKEFLEKIKESENQPSEFEKLRGDIDFLIMEIGVELYNE